MVSTDLYIYAFECENNRVNALDWYLEDPQWDSDQELAILTVVFCVWVSSVPLGLILK